MAAEQFRATARHSAVYMKESTPQIRPQITPESQYLPAAGRGYKEVWTCIKAPLRAALYNPVITRGEPLHARGGKYEPLRIWHKRPGSKKG